MKNSDKLAFPVAGKTKIWEDTINGVTHYDNETIGGLTKREYFTGLAMQGLASRELVRLNTNITNPDYKNKRVERANEIAEMAVVIADELLKKLEDEK